MSFVGCILMICDLYFNDIFQTWVLKAILFSNIILSYPLPQLNTDILGLPYLIPFPLL